MKSINNGLVERAPLAGWLGRLARAFREKVRASHDLQTRQDAGQRDRNGRVLSGIYKHTTILGVALLLVACGGSEGESSGDGTRYTCSMHPQVMQDRPGSCPLCGMDLVPVKKKAPEKKTESGSTTYTCSMHPQVKQDGPGSCPLCGMDLVPVKKSPSPSEKGSSPSDPHAGHDMKGDAGEEGSQHPSIQLESAQAAVLSAKTAIAEKRSLLKEVQLFGEIAAIADRETIYSWYYDGRVEEVLVDFNTTEMQQGQPLLKVYSEAAIGDQEMILKLLRERWLRTFYERDNLTAQISAVKQRLQEAGMTAEELESMKGREDIRKYFTLRAPRSGSLIGMLPREGMRFSASDTLFRIAPLDEVWFVAEVFEKDIAFLKLGQRLRVNSKAHPDRSAMGEVVYLDRMLDPKTRTLNVRVQLPNPDLSFLPNLSAIGTLRVRLGEVEVAIPPSAVIETGTREVVYVATGPGQYEQRPVKLGARTEDWVEVTSGVQAGENVVTEGAFLIDAEAQLKGGGVMEHNH